MHSRDVRASCKVCGRPSRYVQSIANDCCEPRLLDLYQCGDCGLAFVGTPVTDAQLSAAYVSQDSDSYYQEIATTAKRKVDRSVEDLKPLLKDGGDGASVLDVGCGYGGFLEAIAGEFPLVRALGQELPGKSADECTRKGLEVCTSRLDEIPERFQVITLLDVAEHVPDPNATFEACFSLLEDLGYVYLHTPRRCFWDTVFLLLARVAPLRRLTGVWLRTRVSIFHLQLWTDKALRISVEAGGGELVYLHKERELGWPISRYARVYLKEQLGVPMPIVRLVTGIAELLFVRFATLNNKAVCLARKKPASGARRIGVQKAAALSGVKGRDTKASEQ